MLNASIQGNSNPLAQLQTSSSRRVGIRVLFLLSLPAILLGLTFIADPRFRLRSRGSAFRELDRYIPDIRLWFILSTVSAIIILVLTLRTTPTVTTTGRIGKPVQFSRIDALNVIICGLAGFLAGWVTTSRTANARYHWVEYFTNVRGERTTNYFYFTTRVIHGITESFPYVASALISAVFGFSTILIANSMHSHVFFKYLASTSIIWFPPLTPFLDPSEDLYINNAMTMVAIAVIIRRPSSPIAHGLAFCLVGLTRLTTLPTVLVFGCLLFFLWRIRTHKDEPNQTRIAALVRYLAISSVPFLLVNGSLWRLGDPPLKFVIFGEGGAYGDRNRPIDTDGFLISQFSGIYIGHGILLFGAFFLFAVILVSFRYQFLPRLAKFTFFAVSFAIIVQFLVLEYFPLHYYNIRYLLFVWPLVLVLILAAIANLDIFSSARLRTRNCTLGFLFAGSLLVVPAFGVHGDRIPKTFLNQKTDTYWDLREARGFFSSLEFDHLEVAGDQFSRNEVDRALMTSRTITNADPDQLCLSGANFAVIAVSSAINDRVDSQSINGSLVASLVDGQYLLFRCEDL